MSYYRQKEAKYEKPYSDKLAGPVKILLQRRYGSDGP